MYFDQSEYTIRCEWGPEGLHQLAPISDVLIIVDVFSFTTSVDVAVSRGAWVYPYGWKDESLLAFASSVGAIPAIASRTDPEGLSLSPSSLLRLQTGQKIVLASPNGAALSVAAGEIPTFAGCLRNADAVAAAAVQAAAARGGNRISVIPAGERWKDGTLRPGLEDLLGAGAILQRLPAGSRSPEAEAAIAVFAHFRGRLEETLAACSSGKECADRGPAEDVRLAAALNASPYAPQLIQGAYQSQAKAAASIG